MNDLTVSAVMPLVQLVNGQPSTLSTAVADYFGKAHRTVLRDIRALDCSEQFRLHNFVQSSYRNQQGKEQPEFRLSYDGLVFLVMGWQGERAAAKKEAYIAEFNRMRAALQVRPGHVQVPQRELEYLHLRHRELISLQRQHIRLQRQHMRLQRELLGLRLPRSVDHTQGDLFAGGAA